MRSIRSRLLECIDFHFLVIVTISIVPFSLILVEKAPWFDVKALGVAAVLISAMVSLFSSLALWPFEKGIRRLAAYLTINVACGAVICFVILLCVFMGRAAIGGLFGG